MWKKAFVFQIVLLFLNPFIANADEDLISLFPMQHYNQSVDYWINPNNPNYDQALLTPTLQQKRFDIFYDHYLGAYSPWNSHYVTSLLEEKSPDDITAIEKGIIEHFNNQQLPPEQIGYGINFRPYSHKWLERIEQNINLAQLEKITFNPVNRGIAVDNLNARALPTDDPFYYSHKIAGEGYPFDYLQMSSLWIGSPVYIVGETVDHVWSLVITADYLAWVKSNGIARVSDPFISEWQVAAKNKLAAITHTQTSLTDENNRWLGSAYVGAIFPATTSAQGLQLWVPSKDSEDNAVISHAFVGSDEATLMPLQVTPHHFAMLIKTLIGRPYGWGNLNFYNDCSAELKNLFTPFGIWLPRHSTEQVDVGKKIDKSSEPLEGRLNYLAKNGRPFLTLIYVGGHVILYIGNYSSANDSSTVLTYQDMWGLSPYTSDRRAVVGKSVFFPLLAHYPEDESLRTQANKTYFQISYLNELPDSVFLNKLKWLMYLEIPKENKKIQNSVNRVMEKII